jgi:hypothetical protein
MTVAINIDRKAVEVSWDTSVVLGETADLKAVNGEDVSTRSGLKNDGFATVTFPADYSGSAEISVTGSEGGTDEGTITV